MESEARRPCQHILVCFCLSGWDTVASTRAWSMLLRRGWLSLSCTAQWSLAVSSGGSCKPLNCANIIAVVSAQASVNEGWQSKAWVSIKSLHLRLNPNFPRALACCCPDIISLRLLIPLWRCLVFSAPGAHLRWDIPKVEWNCFNLPDNASFLPALNLLTVTHCTRDWGGFLLNILERYWKEAVGDKGWVFMVWSETSPACN